MDGDFNNEAAHVLMADVIPSVTVSNHTPSIDVTNLVEAAAKETLQLQNNMVVHYPAAVTCKSAYDEDTCMYIYMYMHVCIYVHECQ